MNLTRTLFAIGLVAATAAVSISSANALARIKPNPACKNLIIGNTGKSTSKPKAHQRARGNWESRSRKAVGLQHSNWHWAGDKQYSCSKKGKWYRCSASAFPCPAGAV